MKNVGKLIVVVVLLAAGAGAVYWYSRTHNHADEHAIRVSGSIETTVAEVSFKIPGRVERRLVDEGEMVHQGVTVALLDTQDLQAELAMQQADEQVAEAALAELLAGSRPQEIAASADALAKAQAALTELENGSRPQEIAVGEAAVARAEADLREAQTNFERVKDLNERGLSAQQEYDDAVARYHVAEAALQQAKEQLKLLKLGPRQEQIDQARAAAAQAQQQYDLVKIGPRQEQIDQARARLAQAKASVTLAQTRLDYATVKAPLTAMVLSKNIEPGEYVAPGTPIVTIGDLENVWLRAYINETDLGRVKLGQAARVTTDTYPGKAYTGRVAFIASQAEFTPKNVQTEQERVKLVYRIKIDIHNPSMELKPGMPADAEILVNEAPTSRE